MFQKDVGVATLYMYIYAGCCAELKSLDRKDAQTN